MVQIIILRSQDVYNALNVEILIYGFAPIEVRPRQDGVRLDIFLCFPTLSLSTLILLLFMMYDLLELFWHQDCCQYHQAKDGDGWVEYKGSLVFDRPQKVISFHNFFSSFVPCFEFLSFQKYSNILVAVYIFLVLMHHSK